MMKYLVASLISLLVICCFAADNNPRVIRIKGFSGGFWLAPVPAYSPSNELTLFGWWKADSITNLVNGSSVVYWTDSSGHNLHMLPADANSPYWTNNFQNSKPAVFFDGVNDYMTNAAAMEQTNVLFFVISHRIPNTSSNFLFEARDTDQFGSALSAQRFGWMDGDYNSPVVYAGASLTVGTGPETNVITTYTIQFAANSGQMWANGVSLSSGPVGTGSMLMGMNVGQGGPFRGAQFYKGYLLEMFCLTNTYATQGTVLQDGCNYLRAKYAHY